jgi:hypothetical protein
MAASTPITASRPDRPDAASRQLTRRKVVRQRQPAHGADAERDEGCLEPELRAEGPAARRHEQAHRSHRGAGKKRELQEAGGPLHDRMFERAQGRNDERRDQLESERPTEPAPGTATSGFQFLERGRSPGDGDGGERRRNSGNGREQTSAMTAGGETRDRGYDAEGDSEQDEPGRPVVKPRRHGVAQRVFRRLFAVQLH